MSRTRRSASRNVSDPLIRVRRTEKCLRNADQPFDFGTGSICDRCADDNVVLPAIAVQNDLERRQTELKKRHILAAAQLSKARSERGGEAGA